MSWKRRRDHGAGTAELVLARRAWRLAPRNAKEAIEAYMQALIEDGLPVPLQTESEQVDVEVSAR